MNMNFIKKMTLTLIGATIIATNGIAQSVQHTTQGITYTTQEIDVKVEFYSPTIVRIYKTPIKKPYKKEVGVLFFIPAILPMIIMMFLIVGANQVFGEAILQENLFLTYGIVTLAVFGGIYLLYYWATTSVFQYAVLKKGTL